MSGGKSSVSSSFGDILGGIAEKINKEVDPLRKMFLGQLKDVLGGQMFTNSALPLIQSGVAAARQAGSASLSQAQASEAASGVARSPFSAAINSVIGQGTEQQIGAVPGQVSEAMLGQVGSSVTNIGGQALSGLSSAAQTNYRTNYGGWQTPSFFGLLS